MGGGAGKEAVVRQSSGVPGRGAMKPQIGVSYTGAKLSKKLRRKFDELRRERPAKHTDSEVRIDGLAVMPEFVMHPMLSRIIQVAEQETNKESFSFQEFEALVRVFTNEADFEQKAALLFKLYDFKNQGMIDTQDMLEVYGTYLYDGAHWNQEEVHCQIPDDVLRPMVDRYIDLYDKDQDGGLNLREFLNAVGEGDVHYLMSISLF